ncbi:MAG: integrase core domain-containing protein [Pyrinomonadaceae bacterium]
MRGWGLKEVLSAPRSPWQAYVERLIGSIRREGLDHVVVINEHHLRRILRSYFGHYHRTRTHLSVGKDAPDTQPVHLPAMGTVIEIPEGGWAVSSLRAKSCLRALIIPTIFLITLEQLEGSVVGHHCYCLKLFEASSYYSDEAQENRRAGLNRCVHSPAARIEFLATTVPKRKQFGLGPCCRPE